MLRKNLRRRSTLFHKPGRAGAIGTDQTAVRITTTDAGYTLPVVTAGEKVLSNYLDPFEAKLPKCIGILFIIPDAEIGEMMLEDLMEGVSSPRKVLGLLFFQYGSILYTHIKYYCENDTDASPIGKKCSPPG